MPANILLEVKNLAIHFDIENGVVEAVKNISFTVKAGEASPSSGRAAAARA